MAKADKALPKSVYGRLWVEAGGTRVLTDATADLLEQIDICGSLSEAARRLCFAYRRAWLLVDAANRAWPEPLVRTATGGKQGGGATLTETGKRVLAAYRDLQIQLEHLIDAAGDAFDFDPPAPIAKRPTSRRR